MNRFVLAASLCLAIAAMMGNATPSAATSIDFCTAVPKPDSVTRKWPGWERKKLGPGGTENGAFYDGDHVTRVWCYAEDDQHPPRTGYCVGRGTDHCLQGYLGRSFGPVDPNHPQANGFLFLFHNEHSRDTRYITLYVE
jgi:hypothetical protein